jgi:zinc/manganese transport system permease protein
MSGFFSSSAVQVALCVGALVALVTGGVGIFTVIRGQSFAAEALGDVGATGGSAAFIVGAAPLWGFLTAAVVGAGSMELAGTQRARGRDLATGVVLGAGTGIAALLLYLDATLHNTSGAAVTILFGSVFAIAGSSVPAIAALAFVALTLISVLYRPLLLSSINADIAAARGVPVRFVAAAYLLALGLATALAAITIGTILSTALIVGPAATSLRLTQRPSHALLGAVGIAIGSLWAGIALAYASYSWPPQGQGWPVSFFVVAILFVSYVLSGLAGRRA